MDDLKFDADVAIIGYGPSGVSAANFLGARGVKTVAMERATDIYPRARAVTMNDWTLRIFQSVGLDDALKSVMDETFALRWITYDGHEINRVGFPPGEMGHPRSFSIYQPAMEEKLREGAARFADHVTVRYGVDVVDVVQDAEAVSLTTVDAATGMRATTTARYALACDGGSSATRERLGIPLLGDTVDTRWVVIDARVKRWWPNRHILTFWSDPARPVVDIALAMGNHRWELPLAPDESESDFETHEQLWRLLATLGVSRDDVEIHQHAFYKHHVRHAERWRDGRIFLLGDAAHLMPPWAGQGMQSGMRDADNLCWKLDAVLNGRLPDGVLDTYQPERAPDVERYTQLSVGLGRLIRQELSEAELAAMRPPPGEAPPPSPLLAPPTLYAGWLTGAGDERRAVGEMIPQPRVATADGRLALLDTVLGDGFVLLGDGLNPQTLLTAAQRAQWDRLDASYRIVRPPDQASGSPDDIIDIGGALIGWMRSRGARVIALRPDRFVAAADTGGLAVPGSMEALAQTRTPGRRSQVVEGEASLMRVAIIGATGLIGVGLVPEAAGRGHSVTALCRHPDDVPAQANVDALRCDIFETRALQDILAGHDAVIHSYSPRRDHDQDRGAPHAAATRSIIAATRGAGVRRLLAVGGAGTLLTPDGGKVMDSPDFPPDYMESARSTAHVLAILQAEADDLDWTFLCPSLFFDARGRSGVFRLGGDQALFAADGRSAISIEDYAVAMIDELEHPRHTRQRFTVGY